jgi:hypothetical protein
MQQKQFKITVSLLLLPIATLCFYFGLKDPTMKEIVDMANDKCEDLPNTDSARSYCMVNYVDSYCTNNWKNKDCHEFQMRHLNKAVLGDICR